MARRSGNGWAGRRSATGEVAAALGLIFRLNQMSGYMMFNINGLIRNFATVQDATTVISVEPAIRDGPTPQSCRAPRATSSSMTSPSTTARRRGVIDNLDLHIRPGDKVALVGPSGAGKTTVVNLALRLFDVESGRILIDGRDIRSVTQARCAPSSASSARSRC
jgi:ATP-binding cassette subfamily B multidrug efflux pump